MTILGFDVPASPIRAQISLKAGCLATADGLFGVLWIPLPDEARFANGGKFGSVFLVKVVLDDLGRVLEAFIGPRTLVEEIGMLEETQSSVTFRGRVWSATEDVKADPHACATAISTAALGGKGFRWLHSNHDDVFFQLAPEVPLPRPHP